MKVKLAKTITLLVAGLALSVTLFGCGATEPETRAQIPTDPAAVRGLSLYNAQCKVCHGANGSGGSGSRLVGKTPSASYIKANMPRTKPGSLSDEQVNDLVAYITFLK